MALSQNGGQWRYDIHQGNVGIADVVTGVVQRVFVRATGIAEGTGDVIAEIDRNGAVHYYLPNHRGDTVLCVTNNGVSVSYLRYDAFGNCVTNIGSFTPRYTFSTKEYLDAVELYLYAYRLYDPVSGRWTQRDPVDYLDSVNLYQFCGNNPVNSIDEFGDSHGGLLHQKDVPFQKHYPPPPKVIPRPPAKNILKPSLLDAAKDADDLAFERYILENMIIQKKTREKYFPLKTIEEIEKEKEKNKKQNEAIKKAKEKLGNIWHVFVDVDKEGNITLKDYNKPLDINKTKFHHDEKPRIVEGDKYE
jgi:RHS repeat-associated protein